MVLGITTAREYREKTQADLEDLEEDIINSRYAINAVTSVYHLHEWLWSKNLKSSTTKQVLNPTTKKACTISNLKLFKDWLDTNCPHFKLVQDLTNGSKHTFSPQAQSDEKVIGFGLGPYGVGPFGANYLLIDLGDDTEERYLVASDVISEAGKFMVDLSISLGE